MPRKSKATPKPEKGKDTQQKSARGRKRPPGRGSGAS